MNSKQMRLLIYIIFTIIITVVFYHGLVNDVEIIKKVMAYSTIGALALFSVMLIMISFEYAFSYKGELSFKEYFKSETKREFFNKD